MANGLRACPRVPSESEAALEVETHPSILTQPKVHFLWSTERGREQSSPRSSTDWISQDNYTEPLPLKAVSSVMSPCAISFGATQGSFILLSSCDLSSCYIRRLR